MEKGVVETTQSHNSFFFCLVRFQFVVIVFIALLLPYVNFIFAFYSPARAFKNHLKRTYVGDFAPWLTIYFLHCATLLCCGLTDVACIGDRLGLCWENRETPPGETGRKVGGNREFLPGSLGFSGR